MNNPPLLPDECIASDDPTWIIDTSCALLQAPALQTPRSKRSRAWLRWTLLSGLMMVAGAASHVVAITWFPSVFEADVPHHVVSRGDDAVAMQTAAIVPNVKNSAPGVPSAHAEPAKTHHERNEAEREASPDGEDQRGSSIPRTLALGRRLLETRRLAAATAAFKLVLAKRPGHPAALCGLARVALVSGKLDVAKKYATRCVRRAPYHAAHHIVLGDVLRRLSQTEAADAEYRRASRLSPSRPIDVAARSLPANPF